MLTHCDGNQLRIVSMHHSLIPPMDGQTLADVGNTHILYYLILRWFRHIEFDERSSQNWWYHQKKCSKTMINLAVQLTKLWEQKWLKPWNCIYFSLKRGGDKRDYKWMPFKCCVELKIQIHFAYSPFWPLFEMILHYFMSQKLEMH